VIGSVTLGDSSGPLVPNGPGVPAPARWRDIRPELSAEPYVFAGSALTDIGLTALFSRTLADAGISCNVIAGLAHDHLFVGWEQGERACALLSEL
jgi:hypothetical protein